MYILIYENQWHTGIQHGSLGEIVILEASQLVKMVFRGILFRVSNVTFSRRNFLTDYCGRKLRCQVF